MVILATRGLDIVNFSQYSDPCTLCIPSVRTKSYGQRAFSHSAPLWNYLSKAIKNSESALSFKLALKSYLFQRYNSTTGVCVYGGVCTCLCVCVYVCVRVCVCDLYKRILVAIDELRKALRSPERRGTVNYSLLLSSLLLLYEPCILAFWHRVGWKHYKLQHFLVKIYQMWYAIKRNTFILHNKVNISIVTWLVNPEKIFDYLRLVCPIKYGVCWSKFSLKKYFNCDIEIF